MTLKSIISSHTLTPQQVFRKSMKIVSEGELQSTTYGGLTEIQTYKYRESIYTFTFIADRIVGFELRGAYCFVIPNQSFQYSTVQLLAGAFAQQCAQSNKKRSNNYGKSKNGNTYN